MIKELVKLANELDSKGLRKEADYLDSLLKAASRAEGLEHEEHAKSLEAPGAEADQAMHDFYARENAKMVDARKVAEWIVGGTPVFGQDAETDIDELTDMLSADEHKATVKAILSFSSRDNNLGPEGDDSEEETLSVTPQRSPAQQQEAERVAHEAMADVRKTIEELQGVRQND